MDRGVTTLIRKGLVAVRHDIQGVNLDYLFIDVIPQRHRKYRIFILNLYSNPSKTRERFLLLLKKATTLAGPHPLLIGGDFNAPHPAWGYGHATVKGKHLWQDSQDLGLTIITDPSTPTRMWCLGIPSCPTDLTMVKNIKNAKWQNTTTDLGSDHMIIEIKILTLGGTSPLTRSFVLTDWDKFRRQRDAAQNDERITDIDSWTAELINDVVRATQTITTEIETEKMDSRLAHLNEAKTSILNRQQWDEVCNAVDGQLHNGQTWKLLKRLLDETKSKSNQRDNLRRLLYTEINATDRNSVIQILINKYLPQKFTVQQLDYRGEPNPTLDEPFSMVEIRTALHGLNGKSAPGPDRITNKSFRNLDDMSIDKLTEFINGCWKEGNIPLQWKTSKVILIPKPENPRASKT
ncbi:uncharacterized protein LOC119447964 [Dermacentor silvarum]|uniref:uncharacterized protein LOC119447964 n=1 Tax=Dermacentor silvarum TaxID=543639 RepID=UPI00189B5CD8|nr:uncharacterized protein LOC119447964 [Dermacentor silvarum]